MDSRHISPCVRVAPGHYYGVRRHIFQRKVGERGGHRSRTHAKWFKTKVFTGWLRHPLGEIFMGNISSLPVHTPQRTHHMHTHMHAHIHTHTHTHTKSQAHTHAETDTDRQTDRQTNTHTHIYAGTQTTHTETHTNTRHTRTSHTPSPRTFTHSYTAQ